MPYILLCIIVGSCIVATGGRRSHRDDVVQRDMYNYYYMEGEKQMQLGHYDAALALASEAHRIYPEGHAAQYSLAKIFLMLGQVDTATHILHRITEQDTTHFWYNISYGNLMLHTGRYAEAERVLQRIVRNHPDHPDVYYALANVYINTQAHDKALACYDSIEAYMGNSPDLMGLRIEIYDAKGDTATAIAMAEKLLERNPTDLYSMLYLSDIYCHYKRNEKMLPLLEQASAINPDEPLVYTQKAAYHLLMGDTVSYRKEYERLLDNENISFDEKVEAIDAYVKSMPQNTPDSILTHPYKKLTYLYPYEQAARNKYAAILIHTGEREEACRQLKIMAEQGDEGGLMWEQTMTICIELQQYGEAIEAGRRAIEAGRREGATYLYLSNALVVVGDTEAAEECIHSGIAACGESNALEKSYLYGMLGDLYSLREDMLQECYQSYDSALVYNPNNKMILNNYAYKLACNNGDLMKAESMSGKAMKGESNNPTYIDTYAWILFKMNSYTLARIYIEKAIEIAAKEDISSEYYEHYGDILIMLGETDKAIEQWQKALELDPSLEIVKKKIELKQYIEK